MKYTLDRPSAPQMLSAAILIPQVTKPAGMTDEQFTLAMSAMTILVDDYLAQCANTWESQENGEYENSLTLGAAALGLNENDRDAILKRHNLWHNPESRTCASCGRVILQTPDTGTWVVGDGEWNDEFALSPVSGCWNPDTRDFSNAHAPSET